MSVLQTITVNISRIKNGWLVSISSSLSEDQEFFTHYAAACASVYAHLDAHIAKLRTMRGMEGLA